MLRTAHFSFTVEDLDRSAAFYRDVLGMRLLRRADRRGPDISGIVAFENAHLKIAYLELPGAPGMELELIEYLSPKGEPMDRRTCNPGSAHICFGTDDVHAAYASLASAGVQFRSEPVLVMTGGFKGGYALYFLDPDGNTLELVQAPKMTASDEGGAPA